MKKISNHQTYSFDSISEMHQLLGLPKIEHPLMSIVSFEDIKGIPSEVRLRFAMNFYVVAIKKGSHCKMKHGSNYYDFDSGVMTFIAPGTLLNWEITDTTPSIGWLLIIHPDFIRQYNLGKKITEYGFFHYTLFEALHLSEREERMLQKIMRNIKNECYINMDGFSQDVIISLIELLLNYSNRFYNRQFLTRKTASHEITDKLEIILSECFTIKKLREHGLPTVTYISDQLNLSPNYLADMLKHTSGLTTQQHIHKKLIEVAKDMLTSSSLSISEIAYSLGFEFPQSFSKLFKQKTNLSPLGFRNSFI